MTWLSDIVAAAHAALLATPDYHPARRYAYERGLTEADIVTYRLGYWEQCPTITQCTPEFWKWAQRYGTNRLLFPVTDPFGTVIGMQGRHLGDKGYENFILKPTELYLPCFGLHVALPAMFTSKRVVLVEGVFDYFATVRYAADTLCTLTANVSLAHKRLLSRYVSLAVCLFDMDSPGRRAAYRLAGLPVPEPYRKPEDVTGRPPTLPPFQVILPPYSEHDPDDLRKKGKWAELEQLVSTRPLLT